MGELSVHAGQSAGPGAGALAPCPRVPPLVQCRARHRHPRHPRTTVGHLIAARSRRMSEALRLPSGGRIDRGRRLAFRFDGRSYEAHPGDTLASALLANGVRIVGRSFKYHRPRGVFIAGVEEPNALVQIGRGEYFEPNVRATQIELYEGLEATSQNNWPSLRWDLGAVSGLIAPLLASGFYYKTFMPSQRVWQHLFEPLIRRI